MSLERLMQDDVTHWPITGSDGFGGFTFGTVVKFKARWEDKNELFIDLNGEQVTSRAVVYIPDEVPVGDYLALGDKTAVSDPTTIDGPFRVRAYQRSTDLSGLRSIMRAIL